MAPGRDHPASLPPPVLLDGTWEAMVADAPRATAAPGGPPPSAPVPVPDSTWTPIEVPGHWRSTPGLGDCDGPVRYRRQLDLAPPTSGVRSWLVLDGVFYASDLWLDGRYLGDTEGYFFPHAFEITDQLAGASSHDLTVEVACTPQRDRRAKRNLTGVFQHWDLVDQDWNPGGIWRSVRIEHSGPVRIKHLRVLCLDADESMATVFIRAVVDADRARGVAVTTSMPGTELTHTEQRTVAAGENYWEWTVTVPEPELWWPWSLGPQPLHDIVVRIATDEGEPCDERHRRIGLRSVASRNWIVTVNGERLFLKGANQGPTRMALGEATGAELARDVTLAKEAGLDLLRVHGHISRTELYDAADEAGMLLWQDLPLQWGYSRSVRAQARRQARLAVDELGHHPSVALWCGHNEPFAIDAAPETLADPAGRRRLALAMVRSTVLPAWNKTVLDHSIARVLRRCDGSRPVVPHSGVLPHPPQLDGTDAHLYFGWYHGDHRQFPTALRWWPRLGRFVSEFGAQAVPDDADFCSPDRWPDLDWQALHRHHALQRAPFDRYVPPARSADFASWRDATQRYQAEVVKLHVETLRRLKYRPCGGFAQFCFGDGAPLVSWSVLDVDRRPKLAHRVLTEACRPVIAVADWPPEVIAAGGRLRQHVHVVSDRRTPIEDLVLVASVHWTANGTDPAEIDGPGEDAVPLAERRWAGEVGADAVAFVGTLDLELPHSPGTVWIDLHLTGSDVDVANRYRTRIG